MAFALSQFEDRIYIRNSETCREGVFSATTGERLRGDLDIEPQEVLFKAWSQVQSPKLTEKQLRDLYDKKSS